MNTNQVLNELSIVRNAKVKLMLIIGVVDFRIDLLRFQSIEVHSDTDVGPPR